MRERRARNAKRWHWLRHDWRWVTIHGRYAGGSCMKTLTIDCDTWLRGYQSELRDGDGHMCCLGFDALACGFAPDQIRGHSSPLDLTDHETQSILRRDSLLELITR